MSKQTMHDDTRHALRHALGQYTTGVAVVTALGNDAEPVGMTINSFGSVSLEPALVSWCIDRRADSYEAFVNADRFRITVLAQGQADLATRFATRGADKFRGIETGVGTVPVVAGGCAWFECERHRAIALGDHTMLVGEILEFACYPAAPLVFAGGGFRQLVTDAGDARCATARAA
jgi:flavin reductase (DIM6/NTAB) family NADH-FMN oxidoreductase RutF